MFCPLKERFLSDHIVSKEEEPIHHAIGPTGQIALDVVY